MKIEYFFGVLTLLLLNQVVAQPPSSDIQQNEVFQLMESAVATATPAAIAKADIARAEAAATVLRVGPYEFQAAVSGGRREVSEAPGNQEYSEWSAGLSRTLRLPGKRSTDQDLAQIEVQLANAAYENALFEERMAFIGYWTTWSAAFKLAEIAEKQAEEAMRIAKLEQIQVEKGAGRQINADQLKAEAELAMLQAEQDEFALIAARMALEANYPDISLPLQPSAVDLPLEYIESLLETEIGKSPKQLLAELSSERARLVAQRARQDRFPDPTIGFEFTDEFDGQESAIKAQISIPIGGTARRASSRLAYEQMNMSAFELDLANRVALQQRALTERMARLSHSSKTRTDNAAMISMTALENLEQGYESGAVRVSDLITARRSHYLIERVSVEQKGENERAFLNLLVMHISASDPELN